MRREHLIYVLLFCVSYAGFLGYFYRNTNNTDAAAPTQAMRASTELSALPYSATTVANVAPATVVSIVKVPTQPQRMVQGAHASQDQPATTPTPLVIDYTSPQATFRTLETAAINDEYSENRAAAVARLRQLAANGDADGQIREALRIAATDADPTVADSARAAYAEVSEWTAVRN